jgi:hypothetical protein
MGTARVCTLKSASPGSGDKRGLDGNGPDDRIRHRLVPERAIPTAMTEWPAALWSLGAASLAIGDYQESYPASRPACSLPGVPLLAGEAWLCLSESSRVGTVARRRAEQSVEWGGALLRLVRFATEVGVAAGFGISGQSAVSAASATTLLRWLRCECGVGNGGRWSIQ